MSGSYVALVLVVLVVRVVLVLAKRRGDDPARPEAARPAPDDPRWLPARGEAQTVGKVCARCEGSFVLAGEARKCKACGALVHRKGCYREHKMAAHEGKSAPYR